MHETSGKCVVSSGGENALTHIVLECLYLAPCAVDPEKGTFKFVGVTIFDDKPFLLSFQFNKKTDTEEEGAAEKAAAATEVLFKINCENTILASMAKTKLVKALSSLSKPNELGQNGQKH